MQRIIGERVLGVVLGVKVTVTAQANKALPQWIPNKRPLWVDCFLSTEYRTFKI